LHVFWEDWVVFGQLGLLAWLLVKGPFRIACRLVLWMVGVASLFANFSIEYLWNPARVSPWKEFDWILYFGGGSMGPLIILAAPLSVIAAAATSYVLGRWGPQPRGMPTAVQTTCNARHRQFSLAELLVVTTCLAVILGSLLVLAPYPAWPVGLIGFSLSSTGREIGLLVSSRALTTGLIAIVAAHVLLTKVRVIKAIAALGALVMFGALAEILFLAHVTTGITSLVRDACASMFLQVLLTALSFLLLRAANGEVKGDNLPS